jgi:hypothetical protein
MDPRGIGLKSTRSGVAARHRETGCQSDWDPKLNEGLDERLQSFLERVMRWRLPHLTLCLVVLVVKAQSPTVLIHIKLIDGRTGRPMANEQVGLENGADYHEISAHTDQFGIASLNLSRDAVILVHNTDRYVNCGDERGGVVHNDFKVSEIFSTGVVQQIAQPNLCGKASGVPRPGELILFVRRWRPGEKI